MNLIDLYVSEVGRRLPQKSRSDIEAEIRSALEDMLEDRSRKEGRSVDDEMTFAVLKEYGDPEKVAASYLPERYLIGPSLYPVFWTLAKLILAVTLIVVLVGLGVSLGQSALDLHSGLQVLAKAVSNFFTSALTSLASLVFLFGLIEWGIYYAGGNFKVEGLPVKKEWDPHNLLKISPPNRISLGNTIADIVSTFFAILIFNFFPQAFTLGYSASGNWYIGTGNWTSIPILSAAFFHFVPFLTVVWILTIVLDILLLSQGYWNTATRIFSITIKVINIAIAAAMLAGPSLIALTAGSLPPALANLEALKTLLGLLPVLVKVVLWLSILGNVIEIIRGFVNMVSNRPLAISIVRNS